MAYKKDALQIPLELEAFRKDIEKTVQPFIKINLKKAKTTLHQSKFAGNPYLPQTMEHPLSKDGKPMKLLAQLNFSEIPRLEPFPTEGILQFFIGAEDDVMGIDFDDMTNQSNFKIVFHSHVIEDESRLVTDFSYMDNLNTEYFPIEHEVALSFEESSEPVSSNDFRLDELLGDVDLNDEVYKGDELIELWEVYSEAFLGEGHKIGGYPFFTQSDPREWEEKYMKHEVLLLQIDTDDKEGIMWGDCGIANFFITKEDLQKRNFTKVIYNWDCH
ncbi:YwqG family protein [Bacillus alkalicellulosilyticus]|uniref:YwqG family protein n=1 Tax=Alkalihalobacterium alkalicellulosilyticum TaxID=1912214 RepID=UPI00099838CB|nr:YwqG family protein [Bacillus alkalicellulosilyticus]